MATDIYKERVAALLKLMQATKNVKEDNIPCKIEEGLYLGSIGSAYNTSALKAFNITHILTTANSLTPRHPNDFLYKVVQIRDREDEKISRYFNECFEFIDEARATGGGILVHCFAGRSRSVTIVVAYLMFKNGMRLSKAMENVKRIRPTASPNSGFMLQLEEYEKSLQGIRTERVHEVSTCSG